MEKALVLVKKGRSEGTNILAVGAVPSAVVAAYIQHQRF